MYLDLYDVKMKIFAKKVVQTIFCFPFSWLLNEKEKKDETGVLAWLVAKQVKLSLFNKRQQASRS